MDSDGNRLKEPIYTTFDISKFLSVDITTVMSWIDEGKLGAYKTPGGHRRVPESELLAFLKKFNLPVPDELLRGKRVLIVDDDLQVVRVIKRILQNIEKLEVEVAEDGFEAGRKFETFLPDLVVLDLFLPKLDGFKVCEAIRKSPTKREVKILAVSGDDTPQNRQKIQGCGADAFLGKPFTTEAFNQTVLPLLGVEKRGA